MANYKLPIITGTSLSIGDVLRWDGSNWVNYADSNYDAAVHTHDTHTLQLDGINSNGGAFAFTTSGAVTFNQNLIFPNGGSIGQTAGPLLTFDDTNNFLEITGCKVGVNQPTPRQTLDVDGGFIVGSHDGGAILWIERVHPDYPYASIMAGYADNNVGVGLSLAYRDSSGTSQQGMYIKEDGAVGFGTGSPFIGVRQTNLATTTLASHYGQLNLLDDTAQAAGVGGIFYFGGKFNDAGGYTTWSAIQGVKETGGTGNYGGGLKFYTRVHGADIGNPNALKMSISSAGIVSIENTLTLKERAAALGDIAAYGQIWVKNTTPCTPWFTNDAGNAGQFRLMRAASINSDSDAADVEGCNVLWVDTSGGNVTLGGLAGGVDNQLIYIFKYNAANNLILEHNEAAGTQKLYMQADQNQANICILQFLCKNGGWYHAAYQRPVII